MLAVMEIPGCLVALYIVSKLRIRGMDALGNMPDEPGYDPNARALPTVDGANGHEGNGHDSSAHDDQINAALALDDRTGTHVVKKAQSVFSPELLHEVFFNPGIFLLFGGILIGYIGQSQGPMVVAEDNKVFHDLFHGILCLFLLEMGMTASRKLRDLKTAGWRFIAFGLVAPNIFALFGITVACIYGHLTKTHLELGTYVVFAVLCGAASYIAVPAVQRLAIPEASPTLPLAASLGLTFSYNVTIGIPVYIQVSKMVMQQFPIG